MQKMDILYPDLNTPCLLANLDVLEENIREMSQFSAAAGVRLRPHIKVHESAAIAKMQIAAGAIGIEVGTLEQAEAMAEAGFDDILIAHPFFGHLKFALLRKLLQRPELQLTLVVDMIEQAVRISQIAKDVGQTVPVLVKVDVGGDRFGVAPCESVLAFVKSFDKLSGIHFAGIYAHEMGAEPTQDGVDKCALEAAAMVGATAKLLKQEGVSVEHVSVGASSTFRSTCRFIMEGRFPEITEIHPGGCIIGDLNYVRGFATCESKCALTVLTTVMSVHTDHAVIDCGAKTFGADRTGRREAPGFGFIRERPDLFLGRMSNETSIVSYCSPEKKLSLGQRLEIVPTNALVVINIHSMMYGVRNGAVEMVIPVTGRGRGN